MIKRLLLFVFTLLLMGLWGNLLPTTANHPTATFYTQQSMNSEQQLIDANSEFGFKLFSTIVKDNNPENVFVSPLSVTLALSLLYNGASGTTGQEMAKVLGFENLSLEDINQANQALQSTLNQKQSKVELAIANSLWARKDVTFNQQFLENSQKFYQAKVTNLDFKNSQSVSTINNWVKDNTRNKIDKIIEQIDPNDVLFLINAIYFKGTWQNEFDKSLTSDQPFYLANGTQKQQPMMSRQGEYQYSETPQFQAISLPYGDSRLSMYIFLPSKETPLNTFLEQLTSQNWNHWLSQFEKRPGLIQIPRFKLEYEKNLSATLEVLGMGSIFQENADFSKMTDLPVKVDEVKHKTFVEVNEEGTEAAAVTSIGIRATSVRPVQEPFTMTVDRPFFCTIRDNQTGIVLFMGQIVEP